MTKRNIQYQQYVSELKNENFDDIVLRLRKTRVDMLGTSDEDHYWDCHDAANIILELRENIRSPLNADEIEALILCKQNASQENNNWMIDQLNSILTRYLKR